MRILFIHQNFPGQFKDLAPALVIAGHDVTALCMLDTAPSLWRGVKLLTYKARRGSTPGIHPWVGDIETKTIRGDACFRKCLAMKTEGYHPDLVVAHPGWGESLFIKDVWPEAKLGIFCEYFYHHNGGDVGFDPEFPVMDPVGNVARLRMKNLNNLLHFDIADSGLSSSLWQADTFPEPFRSKISVIHDGIDTCAVCPNPDASLSVCGRELQAGDEIITFVNRNLEPYRGYHIFMRSLPELLKQRTKALVVIVGGDRWSYGKKPPGDSSWKTMFIDEVRPKISDDQWARVLFTGNIPYQQFVSLLQVSAVHVYLSYPFVLSWSLLEAMSAGCAVVASDTAPVREVIINGETGLLTDFFDTGELVRKVSMLLNDSSLRRTLAHSAREFILAHYDLHRICLPARLKWIHCLVEG